MSKRRYWTEAEIRYLIDSHTTATDAEQAATLGRTKDAVQIKRCDLYRAGLLRKEDRPSSNRPWTPDDYERFCAAIQAGHSTKRAAALVGRSVRGVLGYVQRQGEEGIRMLRDDPLAGVRSRLAVARLFGVTDTVARRWHRNGWLRGTRNHGGIDPRRARRRPQGRMLLFTDEALKTFIAVREAWPSWHPAWITDPDWRAYAEEVRATAGGRWFSTAEVAAHYHFAPDTVAQWIVRGALPGYHDGNAWWVWSADLDGFAPPIDRRHDPRRCDCCGIEWPTAYSWASHVQARRKAA